MARTNASVAAEVVNIFDLLPVTLAIGIASLLIVAAIVIAVYVNFGDTRFGMTIGLLILLFDAELIRRIRRRMAPNATTIIEADRRQPILYFRTFIGDGREDSAFGERPTWKTLLMPLPWLIWERFRSRTSEEVLSSTLVEFGPCVAIGRPGERLPDLGFLRLYCGEDWQKSVEALLERAQLVIIRASRLTAALRWEMETIVERVQPKRILILLPRISKHRYREAELDYDAFRIDANLVLPQPLPESKPDALLLRFGSDWRPIAVDDGHSLPRALQCALADTPVGPKRIYGSPWKRLIAAGIDAVALIAGTVEVIAMASLLTRLAPTRANMLNAFAGLAWYVVPALMTLGCWFLSGTTVGKAIFGLHIVDLRSAGTPRPWQWLVRFLGCLLIVPTWSLSFLWMLFHRRRQAWHDMLARTVVVPHV